MLMETDEREEPQAGGRAGSGSLQNSQGLLPISQVSLRQPPMASLAQTLRKHAVALAVGFVALICIAVIVVEMKKVDKIKPPPDAGPQTPSAGWTEYMIRNISSDGYLGSAERIMKTLQTLTEHPHIAGTQRDLETAKYTESNWKAFGIPKVEIKTYTVYLNYPKTGRVWLDDGTELSLVEPSIPEDKTSSDPDVTRGFHGYSRAGNASGEVVYANYGRVEDYKWLEDNGVDLRGKIVLVRYGEIFRGNKVEDAQLRGAAGVIVYSDPSDDGYTLGSVFPVGPFRSNSSLQRGSVFTGEGDPLSPGYASVEDSVRLTLDESRDRNNWYADGFHLPTIPSVPMSLASAHKILTRMTGVSTPADWRGGVAEVSYKAGCAAKAAAGTCTPVVVNIRNDMEDNLKAQIWNVVGIIPGSVEPDRYVILGNHRDAWVMGAADPNSGSSSVMEVARTFGQAYKAGWRPRRSVMLMSWDAEEYGLVGSVEWGEEFAAQLRDKTVAYFNSDISVWGPGAMLMGGTPSLVTTAFNVARLVPQPKSTKFTTEMNVFDAMVTDEKTRNAAATEPVVDGLGSGSDFTVFLAHLGIPCMDFSFVSHPDIYGQYHSVFDSFEWMKRFGDPQFTHHAAMAAYLAGITQTVADMPVIALDYSRYATEMTGYADQVESAAKNASIALAMPRLRGAIADFNNAAIQFNAQIALAQTANSTIAERIVSDKSMLVERAFLLSRGLKRTSWFKHVIFSPGQHDSYASAKFPDLSDAIFERDARGAELAFDAVVRSIRAAAQVLRADPI